VLKKFMKQSFTICFFILLLFTCIMAINSCSKGGGDSKEPDPYPCSGIVITVSGTTISPSAAGASDGSISVTASGSSGFTFSNNGGTFQSSGTFTNLAAGSYNVVAKNGSGCIGSASFTLTASNACAGVNILVSATTTSNTPCQASNNGSITVTASGGAGSFTYSINGGLFQSSDVFTGLNSGAYSIVTKDANGCTGSANATVNATAAGPLFSAVRTLIQNNCAIAGCHGNVQTPIFTIDCNIVSNSVLIKARAVDGNPSPMPPTGLLPVSERQKITDWINAGGQFNN
jgi:SprB repeat